MTALPQIRSLLQPPETPTPGTSGVAELLRLLGTLANSIESEAQRENFKAVHLLTEKLEALVASKRIARYSVHGWRGTELLVNVYFVEAAYTRRRRMNLQKELDQSVCSLGYYVDATMLVDSVDGESS